jgi:MoxR-like ATPase
MRREPAGRLGPLVGRAADLAAIRDVLSRERLVTLVGAAGVGKSRLAREVIALESPGAVAVLVPLEPIESIGDVPYGRRALRSGSRCRKRTTDSGR